jgi:nickel superoxide dismutase
MKIKMTSAIAALLLATSTLTRAHCQIPCGIFEDRLRITLIEEHITTIEKSMNQINNKLDENQTIRWVLNKEDHADQLTEIITYYFLAQRIKPDTDKYQEKLTVLHQMMLTTMKCKQTTDTANTAKLRELVHTFAHLYFGEDATHTH